MEVHKYPVLLWQDSADFYTAALVDPESWVDMGVSVVGYAEEPKAALAQIKEYLNWFYKEFSPIDGPTVSASKLVSYQVRVRPEFRVSDKIYPYERNLTFKVEVVDCEHHSGMRSAVIPRLGVSFFYSQGQLRDLTRHYVQERLAGQPPQVLGRYFPPKSCHLETVTVRSKGHSGGSAFEPNLENLSVIAEPLGTKSFKSRFSRPYGRDEVVAELVKRLSGRGSNVLLVGEQGSGKTSVLLEAVRKLEKRKKNEEDEDYDYARRYWVTRGARVIAGMRYLGQWEERLEVVVDEINDIQGVLCWESLQEIVQTGGRGPEGSIGAFLSPYMERGEIVMLAEATPRELDACRRLLPGFVDLFSILPVPEFTGPEAQSVLGQVVEQLQRKYRVEADNRVVGECFRLHRRFLPYHAFPGKASQFLHQLFEQQVTKDEPVDRDASVRRFSQETGLPLRLLRDEELLPSPEILKFFSTRVVGQEAACEEVSDLVSTFKAGLNDPERPLGVLLFCGPTGVGKTEMAKAVSECFFGAGRDQDRLVRLDMSEYGGPGATYRLLGTQDRPGELVRRLREQPFSVVLLDEVEKAHPDVFDLLLGVFDEGRLTDPWGRLTTFRSSIIIMTSNLGVSALNPIGFNQSRTPSYSAEIMNFFRPEFFNRIDSVVTFAPLAEEDIQTIAGMELKKLAQREGLERRGIELTWSVEAVKFLAKEGYDARYGARPLKRVIEKKVMMPLARYLVENPHLAEATIEVGVMDDKIVVV